MDDDEQDVETLIILDDASRVASPPVPTLSRRGTPSSASNLGLDIQGIPWNLSRSSREQYRLERMREYALLEMRREPSIYIGNDLQRPVEDSFPMYQFSYLNRSFSCTTQHFQLRHLLWSPTLDAVFFTYGNTLMQWDPNRNIEINRLNFRDVAGGHSRITTICATPDCILVGGFYGELIVLPTVHYDDQSRNRFCRLTNEDNGITNHIKPYHGSSSASQFLISSNDSYLRLFDALLGKSRVLYKAQSAINASCASPNGRLLALASDSNNNEIIDMRTEQSVLQLTGHVGYSFSCDWGNDGNWLVTGNEDHTARVYDVRASSTKALYVLGSRMSSIRNVLFAPDHQTLAVMEESDFVTLYDASADFSKCTTIDFFGETSGISFSADSETFYIGCAETDRGGIMEFKRPQSYLLNSLERNLL